MLSASMLERCPQVSSRRIKITFESLVYTIAVPGVSDVG